MTITELMSRFYNSYCLVKLKPSTCSGYRFNIDLHIIPYIGGIEADELTVDDIDYLVKIFFDLNLSRRTVRYVLAVLRKAYSFGVKRGYVTRNVVEICDFPSAERYDYTVWNDDEINTALTSIYQRDFEQDYILVAVLLSLHYGLRRGEVLGLRWTDFNAHSFKVCRTRTYIGNKFVCTTPKNGKFREIMISAEDYEYIKLYNRYTCRNSEGYLIRLPDGNSPTHLDRAFRKFKTEKHLPNIRYHDLRHSYATYMLRHGVHPKIVSTVLGHSSIDITLDLYSHVDISMQIACLNVFK